MGNVARIRPSRCFLIQQAVIGAIWTEYRHTLRVHRGSVAGVLRGLRADDADHIPGNLIVAITNEFRALSERWAA